jgi:hypothetical protein
MGQESEKTTLALTLADADVQRIIRTTIQAQVAAVLSREHGGLVEGIVQQALGQRIDHYGRPSSSERDPTMLESLVRTEVAAATKAGVIDWLAAHRPALLKAIDAVLKRDTRKIAGQLIDSMVGALGGDGRLALRIQVGTTNRGDG